MRTSLPRAWLLLSLAAVAASAGRPAPGAALDETCSTGRTTHGVISICAPRLVQGGIRLAF
jgi:hypothetical protein